jgi:hypothetical protein
MPTPTIGGLARVGLFRHEAYSDDGRHRKQRSPAGWQRSMQAARQLLEA